MSIPADAELVRGFTIPLLEKTEHVTGGFLVPNFQPVAEKPDKPVESITPPPPLRYL